MAGSKRAKYNVMVGHMMVICCQWVSQSVGDSGPGISGQVKPKNTHHGEVTTNIFDKDKVCRDLRLAAPRRLH